MNLLYRLFASSLISAILAMSMIGAQSPAPPQLPAGSTYAEVAAWLKTVETQKPDVSDFVWTPFTVLATAGRWEAFFQLAKVYHDRKDGDPYQFRWQSMNPVNDAYSAKQYDLVRRLLDLDPKLINTPETGAQSYGPVPLALAVTADDLVWAKIFVEKGADINTGYIRWTRGEIASLWTISHSKAMDDFLLSRHVPTEWKPDSPVPGSINDDKVRFRDSPGLEGKVLANLSNGDKIEVLKIGLRDQEIAGSSRRWYQVRWKGQTGWVFSAFVDSDVEVP